MATVVVAPRAIRAMRVLCAFCRCSAICFVRTKTPMCCAHRLEFQALAALARQRVRELNELIPTMEDGVTSRRGDCLAVFRRQLPVLREERCRLRKQIRAFDRLVKTE
jgi:hypothetical protein